MARVLKVLGVLVLAVVLLLAGVMVWAMHKARGEAQAVQERLSADWARFEPRVMADEALWKNHPLLARHEGGDAAGLLFKHVRLERGAAQAPPLSTALTDALKALGPDWARRSKEVDLSGVDLGWLKELSTYGYWDLEGAGSPLAALPFSPLDEPLPNFGDLQNAARARLMRGLNDGTAGEAAGEVRELARLCLTTDTLIGVMVGTSMLGMEHKAYDEAVRRGQDTLGWTPVTDADAEALKRALWAAQAPGTLLSAGTLSSAQLPVGQCVALRENLGLAWFLKGYLQEELPERYAALTKALDQSPCRLTRARAAWKGTDTGGQLPVSGAAMCMTDAGAVPADCWMPNLVMRFGAVRTFIGLNLATIAATDWFKRYRTEGTAAAAP
jgi:hypothetical protein